jgi:hypothetical protein
MMTFDRQAISAKGTFDPCQPDVLTGIKTIKSDGKGRGRDHLASQKARVSLKDAVSAVASERDEDRLKCSSDSSIVGASGYTDTLRRHGVSPRLAQKS